MEGKDGEKETGLIKQNTGSNIDGTTTPKQVGLEIVGKTEENEKIKGQEGGNGTRDGARQIVHGKEEKMREIGKGIQSVRRLGIPEGQTMKQSSQSKGTEKWT